MSDTSSDSEDTIQNPAKRSKISSLESKPAATVMNFAGHSPTKNTAAQRNLFAVTESDSQEKPSGAHLTAETSHSLESPNQIHPPITLPHPTNSNEQGTDMEACLKKFMDEVRQGSTNTQDKLLAALNEVDSKLGKKVDEIAECVNEVKVDTNAIKGDISGLKEDIKVMKTALDLLVNRVVTLENELEGAKLGLDTLKQQFSHVSTQFRDMKDAQLRSMEHTFDNYLIFRGIPIKDNETPEDLQSTINNLIVKKIGIHAPCNTARRIGKLASDTRPTRVYWMNQDHRNAVLRNGTKLIPIKISKDLPYPVRQVQGKIKARGWELRQKDILVEYRDLGLVINGEFVHHEDIVLDQERSAPKEVETMETA